MELKPGYGIDEILFGMKENDIISLLGQPDKIYTSEDDEDECFYQYNAQKLRLKFYLEEEGRLGYIYSSSPDLKYKGNSILHTPSSGFHELFQSKAADWSKDEYESLEIWFNESLWLTLNFEYDEVSEVEIGVLFKGDDEYDWKF